MKNKESKEKAVGGEEKKEEEVKNKESKEKAIEGEGKKEDEEEEEGGMDLFG